MKHNRRNNNPLCSFKIGDHIRPIAMFEHHDYRRGECYEVVKIDNNDMTLKASDEHGQIGRWIRWNDCEMFNDIGWVWLKGQLSAEALELLSAFEGLNTLALRPEMRIAIIQQTPALKEHVLSACIELESNNA